MRSTATYRLSEGAVVRTAGHIESLNACWEGVQQDGFANHVRHLPLRHFWDVLKPQSTL